MTLDTQHRAPPTSEELVALDRLERDGLWRFSGHELRVTNLDKVVFPAGAGHNAATKRDLIRYNALVAPFQLPYLEGRAVNPRRHPDGADRPGFWHKARPDHAPDYVKAWHYQDADADETQVYSVIDNPAALAWMANYGALELNPWTSRIERPHQPTWALIDIDPGPANTFDDVLTLARLYRAALEHLDVLGMPKVTGQRGIQVWIPVADGYTFDDTRAWVQTISRAVGQMVPELISWAWTKRERGGKARLDYTQNAINKTLVAPFSTRPAPGAPVSMTIRWDELDDPDLAPDRWTITDATARLHQSGDPLVDLIGVQQALPTVT
jgi:bifunctional non-homologous end joining protein LigD